MMLKIDAPIDIDYIELKNSNHGLGVFAKKKILKDEAITFYPVDICLFEDKNISEERVQYLFENYALNVNGKTIIVGDSDNIDDLLYVGHMINDGIDINTDCVSEEIYEQNYLEKNNSKFRSLISTTLGFLVTVVVATKDINVGEEIFVPYTYQYWKK